MDLRSNGGPPAHELLSCTVVAFRSHNFNEIPGLLSQTFWNLALPPGFIGTRSTTKSIMAGTLLFLLQKALVDGQKAPPTLASIINKETEFVNTVCIATTRVPDFGDQLQNPNHGFRYLCDLNEIVPTRCQAIGVSFHPNQELIATDPSLNHPETLCFYDMYRPMGYDMNNHFILIFFPNTSSTLPLSLSAPSSLRLPLADSSSTSGSSLGPSDSVSALPSRVSSPAHLAVTLPSTHFFSSHDRTLPPIQSFHAHSHISTAQSSCADEPMFSVQSSSTPDLPSFPPTQSLALRSHNYPSPHFSTSSSVAHSNTLEISPPSSQVNDLNTTLDRIERNGVESVSMDVPVGIVNVATPGAHSVDLLLENHRICREMLQAAFYDRAHKALYAMVRNFQAMNSILARFGCPLPFRIKSSAITISGDVSASDVLKHFHWTPHSFEHKASWYGLAEHASKQIWKKNTPERGANNRSHFELWLGLKFLWGPSGSIITGNPPNSQSSNPEEKYAATICQKDLQNIKVLDYYFVE